MVRKSNNDFDREYTSPLTRNMTKNPHGFFQAEVIYISPFLFNMFLNDLDSALALGRFQDIIEV